MLKANELRGTSGPVYCMVSVPFLITDSSFLWRLFRIQKLFDKTHLFNNLFIVIGQSLFNLSDFPLQILMAGNHLPHFDKCTNDEDDDFNGPGCIQHISGHDCAMLCEAIG